MTFPSDLQPLVSVELWGRQGFAWDNLQMIPRAMSNLPKPVLQQCQPGASGQGVLSAFSLAGAHAAASLPLDSLLETCRGKNTLLHRRTPRKGSFRCLARLLGTICMNGSAIQHLSPLLVTSSTLPSLFCAFNQLCCENIGQGVLSWSPQPPDYIWCLKPTFILPKDDPVDQDAGLPFLFLLSFSFLPPFFLSHIYICNQLSGEFQKALIWDLVDDSWLHYECVPRRLTLEAPRTSIA